MEMVRLADGAVEEAATKRIFLALEQFFQI
jgi:hypothetical protein